MEQVLINILLTNSCNYLIKLFYQINEPKNPNDKELWKLIEKNG